MPQTNIIFLNAHASVAKGFADHMAAQGILVSGRYGQQRWVTHKDVGDDAIDAALDAADTFFASL